MQRSEELRGRIGRGSGSLSRRKHVQSHDNGIAEPHQADTQNDDDPANETAEASLPGAGTAAER